MVNDYNVRTMARLDNAVIPLFSGESLVPDQLAITDAIPCARLKRAVIYCEITDGTTDNIQVTPQVSPDGISWFKMFSLEDNTAITQTQGNDINQAWLFNVVGQYVRIIFECKNNTANCTFNAWLELLE